MICLYFVLLWGVFGVFCFCYGLDGRLGVILVLMGVEGGIVRYVVVRGSLYGSVFGCFFRL